MIRLLALLALALATPAAAADTGDSTLVGTWTLVRMDTVRPDGSVIAPTFIAGTSFTGTIIYAPDGWVSLQLVGLPRPDAKRPGDIRTYPPEDAVPLLAGYYAYYARYEYDAAKGVVRHRVVQSLRPHEVGKIYTRHVRLTGDSLTLESDPDPADPEHRFNRLVWTRAPRS